MAYTTPGLCRPRKLCSRFTGPCRGPRFLRRFPVNTIAGASPGFFVLDILVDHRRRRVSAGGALRQTHAKSLPVFGNIDRCARKNLIRGTPRMRDAISGIDAGAATHVGKVRQHNEDNYIVATARGFWAVADGMGGHHGGDIASQVVVEELDAILTASTAAELLASCEASMIVANSRLQKLWDERSGTVVGTTVAVLLVFDRSYA